MALQIPKPGSRLDSNARKSVENLENHSYASDPQPESMRFHHHWELLSHCKDKNEEIPQQDDGVTGSDWPVKDSQVRPHEGGPIVTTKNHR